jgi:2-oxoglutarate/2-oxoacid ferredoxin oxidoreductase subunit beta
MIPKKHTSPPYLKTLAERKKQYMKLEGSEKLTWCSGCGDFGIQKALERSLVLENLTTQDVALMFDIGCHGNGSDKIGAYTFHGLHGRVLPAAGGACLANPNIKVIAEAGDGGTFSEGVNHLVHAVRNNYPMMFILHNNENYGLTVGQASSTTRCGQSMNASPDGVHAPPMNPCHFIMGLHPTFVARTFSGDVKHMTTVFQAALRHDGFAFVEVMQLCPTFNKATSSTWFWDRIRYVEDLKGYDVTDLEVARRASADIEKEIMMGILYDNPDRPNLLDMFPSRREKKTSLVEEVGHYDIRPLMNDLY